jgi:hypothetical protein
MLMATDRFSDICIFYPSEDDRGMWVGHSILTDQIGMGESVAEAYAVLKRVIRALLEEAKANPRTKVFSPAPKEVVDRLQRSRPLPKAIMECEEELQAPRKQKKPPLRGNLRAVVDLAEMTA